MVPFQGVHGMAWLGLGAVWRQADLIHRVFSNRRAFSHYPHDRPHHRCRRAVDLYG